VPIRPPLAEREVKAEAAFRQVAKQLSALRTKTAKALSKAVTAGMQELAMAGGRFEIVLEPLPEGASSGLESVEFLVSAMRASRCRALAKVASGGELSRIGLPCRSSPARRTRPARSF